MPARTYKRTACTVREPNEVPKLALRVGGSTTPHDGGQGKLTPTALYRATSRLLTTPFDWSIEAE